MSKIDIFARISVFRCLDGRIFVHDPFYPLENPHNHFFDLHHAVCRFLNQDEINNLSEISNELKEKACKIYLHWKYREASEYVKIKAMENFPLPKSIPNVNEQALIASVRELGQVGIKESASRRFEAIQNICNRQNIQQLVHFTNIDNLVNILSIGLVGRDRKSRDLVKFKTNDEFRFDGYPEAICLSISFPNYRMFYTYNREVSS